MNEKKVVTVIVEGPSDENAIGGILKEFFSWEEVQFAVVHGDITSNYSTTKENVVSKVGALIETIKSKYGYNWGDFVKIIHIADTDGAFTKNCIKEAEVENIQYYEDHMEYFDIEEVEKRNAHKSEIMFKLYTTGKIRNIPYVKMNQKHSKEYKSIGQTIKKYRKLRGLTQEQLADMVCISISYLTKIEAPNCDQPFSLEVILDISEVLDISVHQLLEDVK